MMILSRTRGVTPLLFYYMIKGESIVINKDFILERLTEEQIFERYLGVEVDLHDFNINPLRDDINAGCKFYRDRNTQRLRFKDFSRGWNWDCFDAACYRLSCSFKEVLRKIAEDFGLIDSSNISIVPPIINLNNKLLRLPSERTLSVEYRKFTNRERQYLAENRIDTLRAIKFNFFGLKKALIKEDGEVIYRYRHYGHEIAFCYYTDGQWNLYFPERPKGKARFIRLDGKIIQGKEHLPEEGDFILIGKSYKDIITMDAFNIPTIAPATESDILPIELIGDLQNRFNKIFLLYDNDMPGKRGMVRNIREYSDLIPILFPKGMKKDPTDNVNSFGEDVIWNLIKKASDKLKIQLYGR